MKIILRNLSRETTEADLKALLSSYGNVQSCDLVLDKESGKSKGFAFAQMPHNHQAKIAIAELNGKEVNGSIIRVKKAVDDTTKKEPTISSKPAPIVRQANNPSHGITLEVMVTQLVEHYGFEKLGQIINIRCFISKPSISSSLNFLRRTDWARQHVKELYLSTFSNQQ